MLPSLQNRPWLAALPFGLVLAVHLVGLPVDVMDVDAAQYASIAREMLERQSFLTVTWRGEDYLDKPPLAFWLAAVSYAALGVGTVAYKLPSLLFALLAVFSAGRLGRLLYGREAGLFAALVLASCQALFLGTNDCRTDTVLMGAVALAVWQLAEFERGGGLAHAAWAAAGTGLAMLAKGPIGLVVPLSAWAVDVALRREWRRILKWQWLVGMAIVAVALAPMAWGLFRQFGTRGVAFYFWTQSFGRITGQSAWRNDAGPLFFTHTLLWSFLPWTPVLLGGLFSALARMWRFRFRVEPGGEGFTLGGVIVPFVALSLSRYKLPHYLFVVYPLAAVLAGRFVRDLVLEPGRERAARGWILVQGVVCALGWALALVLAGVCLPGGGAVLWGALAVLAVASAIGASWPGLGRWRIVVGPVAMAAGANLALAGQVYPALLEYQSPSVLARRIDRLGVPPERLVTYRVKSSALDFHLTRTVPLAASIEEVGRRASAGALWVYTDAAGEAELVGSTLSVALVEPFEHFHVTRLNGRFLNPRTRPLALERRALLRVAPGATPFRR